MRKRGAYFEKKYGILRTFVLIEIFNMYILALDIALGSLYCHELDTTRLTNHLIPTLAASCMLQLDGLQQHCEESMLETLCGENVCEYYEAAERYNLTHVNER